MMGRVAGRVLRFTKSAGMTLTGASQTLRVLRSMRDVVLLPRDQETEAPEEQATSWLDAALLERRIQQAQRTAKAMTGLAVLMGAYVLYLIASAGLTDIPYTSVLMVVALCVYVLSVRARYRRFAVRLRDILNDQERSPA